MIQGTIGTFFLCDLDHHADPLNWESGQYGSNDLP